MFNFLKKVFGTRSERELKEFSPSILKINTEVERLKGL
jgi:preprotein translocase subunit SecA